MRVQEHTASSQSRGGDLHRVGATHLSAKLCGWWVVSTLRNWDDAQRLLRRFEVALEQLVSLDGHAIACLVFRVPAMPENVSHPNLVNFQK